MNLYFIFDLDYTLYNLDYTKEFNYSHLKPDNYLNFLLSNFPIE